MQNLNCFNKFTVLLQFFSIFGNLRQLHKHYVKHFKRTLMWHSICNLSSLIIKSRKISLDNWIILAFLLLRYAFENFCVTLRQLSMFKKALMYVHFDCICKRTCTIVRSFAVDSYSFIIQMEMLDFIVKSNSWWIFYTFIQNFAQIILYRWHNKNNFFT